MTANDSQPPARSPYAPPPAYAYRPRDRQGMATAALVTGILGFLFVPLAVLAVIFGLITSNRYRDGLYGLWLGIGAIVVWTVLVYAVPIHL